MPKKIIQTNASVPPQGAYSQGIHAGDFLFVAGHTPLDPITQQVVGDTIEDQTARVLENIRAVLEAGGARLEDVVKTTVYLTDIELFPRFNQAYSKFFPDSKPVRATVEAKIVGDGALVEIEAIAYLGDR
ncbi:MAG TPA: RidA family protein [Anaerolineales bacterium]|nr:RidA family protein [Anaerolineales bacterium]